VTFAKNRSPFSSYNSSSRFGKKKIVNAGFASELGFPKLPCNMSPIPFSFRILITGASSGLVETITDAVSIHSIKKSEYARRLAEGRFGYVTLLDHFKSVGTLLRISRKDEVLSTASRLTEIHLWPSLFERNATSQSHSRVCSVFETSSPIIQCVAIL
jgi:hypothetical protein